VTEEGREVLGETPTGSEQHEGLPLSRKRSCLCGSFSSALTCSHQPNLRIAQGPRTAKDKVDSHNAHPSTDLYQSESDFSGRFCSQSCPGADWEQKRLWTRPGAEELTHRKVYHGGDAPELSKSHDLPKALLVLYLIHLFQVRPDPRFSQTINLGISWMKRRDDYLSGLAASWSRRSVSMHDKYLRSRQCERRLKKISK
jgi:hypothetical protein